jgi:hypothetical protein
MTRRLIGEGKLTPDPIAEPGIYWDQMGCPDVRLLCPTLAQLLEPGKVTQAALSGFLAIVKSYHEALGHVPHQYQGTCNIPIPIEVIQMIGEKLVGKARWSKEYNTARTEAARKQVAKWQAEADAVWLKNPKLSPAAVAKSIAPDNWNYVRQRISKPTK